MREDTENYRQIFLSGVPLMDTRAPVEFSRGSFPGSVNHPLMSDDEREQVGIRYKQSGQQSAIQLGEQLVCGDTKSQRLQAWCEFARQNPEGYLYCFRGGLRSQTVQRWMRELGVDYPLVLGGYKAMRRFLIDELESSVATSQLVLVAGKTGTGKTRVIEQLDRAIDLEGLAHHRGSSFGRLPEPQPSQIDFENALSIDFLRLLNLGESPIVLEDEGKLVGRISLPASLRDRMRGASLLVVEVSLEERVDVILQDYIDDLGQRYAVAAGERGREHHRQHLVDGINRIRKRLGGELHDRLLALMESAFDAAEAGRELHRDWISALLLEYYDPMYDYQMSHREGEVLARGERADIVSMARELSAQ